MLPPHLTLAKPKIGSKIKAFTPSALSSAEPSWQMMWHGLKVGVFKPQAPTLTSVPKHEARM